MRSHLRLATSPGESGKARIYVGGVPIRGVVHHRSVTTTPKPSRLRRQRM